METYNIMSSSHPDTIVKKNTVSGLGVTYAVLGARSWESTLGFADIDHGIRLLQANKLTN